MNEPFKAVVASASLLFGLLVSADATATDKGDAQGWIPSKAGAAAENGARFVRLELDSDRGLSQLRQTFKLEPGFKGALEIEFKSSSAKAARDKGSWIYLRYGDAQGKSLKEQCVLLEKTASWKSESVKLDVPPEAVSLFLSIRQQQEPGALDLKKFEIKSEDGKLLTSLTPEVAAAVAWQCAIGEKVSPDGERVPSSGEIFQPYLKGKAPEIVKDLGTEKADGVEIRKVLFRSMIVDGETQDVFAFIARPLGETKKLPGLLSLHGGWGCADGKFAAELAKAGYVVVAPDLPGIGSPERCSLSTGPWKDRFGKSGGLQAKPSPAADLTFDAIVAGLQAFDLLASQPDVQKDRLGITGISMGAYTTTMLSGLLGERVKAAYTLYGCGFYELGSEWQSSLMNLPDDERAAWLANLDAGRRAPDIKAPFFIAAAVRDHYFWPPAVDSTLSAMPEKLANHAYAPEASHQLTGIPQAEKLRYLFFAYWLKDEGQPFPKVGELSCETRPDGAKLVRFSAKGPLPVEKATLYVSKKGESWEKRTWAPIAAEPVGEGEFQALVPAENVGEGSACYASVSDARPATASSCVRRLDGPASEKSLKPVGIVPAAAK